MKPLDLLMVLALAVIWGMSFLLVRVAAPALGPLGLVTTRMLIAGGVLLGYALLTRRPLPDIRGTWPAFLTLGALNSALPLALEAFAVVQLSASLAAILAATAPLFTVLAAAVWLRERLTVAKVAGVLLGVAGVAVLVGGSVPTGAMAALGVGAMLLAALLYALGGIYTRVAFRGTSPLALSIGQEVLAGLLLLPFALAAPPTGAPVTPAALAGALTLALVMTAGGNLLFFALIARVGPTRTQVVGFLIPVVALLAGALLLGEPVGAGTLAGLAAVFAGVGLVLRPQHGARASITPHGDKPGALARPALPPGPLYDRHSRRRARSRHGLAAGA